MVHPHTLKFDVIILIGHLDVLRNDIFDKIRKRTWSILVSMRLANETTEKRSVMQANAISMTLAILAEIPYEIMI